jgi:putative sigma-54 modulation protein
MQLSTTFRHMDASQAVREYAAEKLEKIRKYFNKDPISAHATFSVERGFHHVADLNITLPSGIVINAKETTEDMYSSIDLVMAKIERQVRRYKEKIRSHKGNEGLHGQREIIHSVLAEPAEAESGPTGNGHAHQAMEPEILKKSKFFAKPLTPNEAVMQMNLLNNDFLVFTNAASHEVNVVYRRGDGTYGLIETGQNGGGKA